MNCDNDGAVSCVHEMCEEDLTNLVKDDDKGVVCEQDRALSVLSVAVSLFEDMQRGCSLSNRNTHLEEVSKLTGVSAPIILYAYKNGTLQAHDLFVKEEMRGRCDNGKRDCPLPAVHEKTM